MNCSLFLPKKARTSEIINASTARTGVAISSPIKTDKIGMAMRASPNPNPDLTNDARKNVSKTSRSVCKKYLLNSYIYSLLYSTKLI